MNNDIGAARRNAVAMTACERLEDSIDRQANDHQVIVGGDDETRAAFRKEFLERMRASPRVAEHFEAAVVAGPGTGAGSLAEFWAGTIEALTTPRDEARGELGAWRNGGSPTDRDTAQTLENAAIRIVQSRARKTAVVVDDLEDWNRSWSRRDEDWSLRKILQTEPKIALVGISATWTVDGHPGYALYCGLSQSRLG